MNETGRRIRAARELKGFNQTKLGELAYVSRFTIGQWESGRVTPDTKNLQNVAKALGKSVDELTGSVPSVDVPPENAPQLKSWVTGKLDEVSRGMNVWMEEIIEAEVTQRMAAERAEHEALKNQLRLLQKEQDVQRIVAGLRRLYQVLGAAPQPVENP